MIDPEFQLSQVSTNAQKVYNFVSERMKSKGIGTVTLNDDYLSVRVRIVMKDLARAQSELAAAEVFDMTPGLGKVTYSMPEPEAVA